MVKRVYKVQTGKKCGGTGNLVKMDIGKSLNTLNLLTLLTGLLIDSILTQDFEANATLLQQWNQIFCRKGGARRQHAS